MDIYIILLFSNGMPAVLAVKMVLARGMDILAYKKFPEDDGILADLRWKQKMPVREDLRLVTVEFSEAEKLVDAERDVLSLVKGVNRLYNRKNMAAPFVVANALEGKNFDFFCEEKNF
jgi:hypothetical protein